MGPRVIKRGRELQRGAASYKDITRPRFIKSLHMIRDSCLIKSIPDSFELKAISDSDIESRDFCEEKSSELKLKVYKDAANKILDSGTAPDNIML